MRCKYCNYEMRETEEFCPRCGMYVEYDSGEDEAGVVDGDICPHCGASVDKDALFCKCGAYLKREEISRINENTETDISDSSEGKRVEPIIRNIEAENEENETKEAKEAKVSLKISKGSIVKSALVHEVIGLVFSYMLAYDIRIIMLNTGAINRFGMSFKTIARLPNNPVFLLITSVCIACALTLIKFRVKTQKLKVLLKSAVAGIMLTVCIMFFYMSFLFRPMANIGKAYWFYGWSFIFSITVACSMITGCILTRGKKMWLNVASVTFLVSLFIMFIFPIINVLRMLNRIIGGGLISKNYNFFMGPVPWIIVAVIITVIVTLLTVKLKKKQSK